MTKRIVNEYKLKVEQETDGMREGDDTLIHPSL